MDMDSFIKGLKARDDLGEFQWHERIHKSKAQYAELSHALPDPLKAYLRKNNITKLYTHQVRSIETIRAGKNLAVMTPTASGKSLIYNLPVLESIIKAPQTRALYIFPLKGLTQDQNKTLGKIGDFLDIKNLSAIYDGDTTSYRRKKIREKLPNIILTNPDMVHQAFLPFHKNWEAFFKDLSFIVIDELHTYRGIFGTHVSNVIRRLRRIAQHYGSNPQFITCSATIDNPKELARMLTGLDFELTRENGAPSAKKNFIFLDPIESPYTTALRVFIASVRAGYKTIAFTKARKITELLYRWVGDQAPDISERVSSYRAGFLPEERREIEARLFSGALDGVISTSALELGIDIGGLDVCILVGYPGTVSSTWQRAGRVGRGERDSLVVLIALEDALDKYFMRNPDDFFSRTPEAAVLDIDNFPIKKSHLLCAATEFHLKGTESVFDLSKATLALKELEDEKKIRHWENGDVWYPRVRAPHRHIDLRASGNTYKIFDEGKKLLGHSTSGRVLKELHPGALYLHMGKQYQVLSLHTGKRETVCRPVNTAYYTAARTDDETEIVEVMEVTDFSGLKVSWGKVMVTQRVTGYWIKDIYTREMIKSYDLKLPSEEFQTSAIWMEVAPEILELIESARFSIPGGLHALEHAQIAALPLFAMCDRMDLGGISYTYNPILEAPAIFIYDGVEGGVGLTLRGFQSLGDWFRATLRIMQDCPCEISCPSCTQDSNCGNGNDPLDKRAAILILEEWLSNAPSS